MKKKTLNLSNAGTDRNINPTSTSFVGSFDRKTSQKTYNPRNGIDISYTIISLPV